MNKLARNLERITRAFGPAFTVLGKLIDVVIFIVVPLLWLTWRAGVILYSGAIEFWAGIKATFPKKERLNINSGADR